MNGKFWTGASSSQKHQPLEEEGPNSRSVGHPVLVHPQCIQLSSWQHVITPLALLGRHWHPCHNWIIYESASLHAYKKKFVKYNEHSTYKSASFRAFPTSKDTLNMDCYIFLSTYRYLAHIELKNPANGLDPVLCDETITWLRRHFVTVLSWSELGGFFASLGTFSATQLATYNGKQLTARNL